MKPPDVGRGAKALARTERRGFVEAAQLDGPANELVTPRHVQRSEYGVKLSRYRVHGGLPPIGDLVARETLDEPLGNFLLARRQRHKMAGGRSGTLRAKHRLPSWSTAALRPLRIARRAHPALRGQNQRERNVAIGEFELGEGPEKAPRRRGEGDAEFGRDRLSRLSAKHVHDERCVFRTQTLRPTDHLRDKANAVLRDDLGERPETSLDDAVPDSPEIGWVRTALWSVERGERGAPGVGGVGGIRRTGRTRRTRRTAACGREGDDLKRMKLSVENGPMRLAGGDARASAERTRLPPARSS